MSRQQVGFNLLEIGTVPRSPLRYVVNFPKTNCEQEMAPFVADSTSIDSFPLCSVVELILLFDAELCLGMIAPRTRRVFLFFVLLNFLNPEVCYLLLFRLFFEPRQKIKKRP